MSISLKKPSLFLKRRGLYILILLIMIGLIGIYPFFKPKTPTAEADFEAISNENQKISQFSVIQENTLLPIPNPLETEKEPVVVDKLEVIVTAYSSSPWETDESPHLTAAGTWVRDGIVANNFLPFGTKIRIPELFGDKIFVVEDRMSWTKGNYHIDIWFPSYWEALNFGVKRTYIEILGS